MDLPQQLVECAPCRITGYKDRRTYRWALSPVIRGQQPTLELTAYLTGVITLKVSEHDADVEPQK